MHVAVPRETAPGEKRVALVPGGLAKLIAAGIEVAIEPGAGAAALHEDDAYVTAGATVAADRAALYKGVDVVCKVQAPSHAEAAEMPATSEAEDHFAFSVCNKGKQKGFVWAWNERVEPKKPRVPRADVVAVRVVDRFDKEALLASDEEKFFTEPHYNGFPAVLVRLSLIGLEELEELIFGAWRCQAPRALADALERGDA